MRFSTQRRRRASDHAWQTDFTDRDSGHDGAGGFDDAAGGAPGIKP